MISIVISMHRMSNFKKKFSACCLWRYSVLVWCQFIRYVFPL